MFPRSPELMSRHDTALWVVDMQEKLLPLIHQQARITWNVRRLIEGAQTLGMSLAATEQYPQGLGPTVASLRDRLGEIPAKLMFSCRECASLVEPYREAGIFKILICGIETHVCIQQTVLDLLGEGFRVYVAADAVGSRQPFDHEWALQRIDSCGGVITTTEAALFEWCEVAGTPEFKKISALVRETEP